MHLFDRIKPSLFAPLNGRNARRTWDLVSRIAENYFSYECTPDYPEGYLRETIIKEIERFLRDNAWESEDGVDLATPINIQSNMIMARLVETGWFFEEKVGARRFITMRPIVSSFFDTLQRFATEPPQLFEGNIQVVHSQLQKVLESPRDNAPGFVTAANLVSRLIHGMNLATLRARDLMKELKQEENISTFVERFFREHIGEIYIQDFRNLRTSDHPLRLRSDILDSVNIVTKENPSLREQLLQGYRERKLCKPGEEEAALQRDVDRFFKLEEVERIFTRMDSVIEEATRRAVAYINYRTRASDRIEEVMLDTITAVNEADTLNLEPGGHLLVGASMVTEHMLRLPAPPKEHVSRLAMKKRQMTPQERATVFLRQAMIENRNMSPQAMKHYVKNRLKAQGPTHCKDIPVDGVKDAVAFLALMRIASLAKMDPTFFEKKSQYKNLGFRVVFNENERIDNAYFNAPSFTIVPV